MLKAIRRLISTCSSKYKVDSEFMTDMKQAAWVAVLEKKPYWNKLSENEAVAYLRPYVRRALMDYCYKYSSVVAYVSTRSEVKAANNLLSYVGCYKDLTLDRVNLICKELNVSRDDIEVACVHHFMKDLSYIDLEETYCPEDRPVEVCLSGISEKIQNEAMLNRSVEGLKGSVKSVIENRWLQSDKKVPFCVLSKMFGLSISGVKYHETEAINTLRSNHGFIH